jgi:hypothetical protein
MSFPRQSQGPLASFSFLASANPALKKDVPGAIVEQADPALVLCVVPPGTAVKKLIASFSLGRQGSVTVVSNGQRTVQNNGITVNDFSAPLRYAVEIPGETDPWVYRVMVREADTNARLAQLTVPAGARLQPAFSPTTEQYTIEVPFTTTRVSIAALAQSRTLASISVAGTSCPGSLAVAVVDFSSGQERAFQVSTLAEDGASAAKYTFLLKRAPADHNAGLSFVDVPDASVSPPAAGGGFTAMVRYEARQVVVRARPQSPVAAISCTAPGPGGGAPVVLGNPAGQDGVRVDFPAGARLVLTLVVTAQDGMVQQYPLEILRAPPEGNSLLADLSVEAAALSPRFSPEQQAYIAEVPYAARQVTIRAKPQSRSAFVALSLSQPGGAASAPTVSSPVFPTYPEGLQVDFSAVDMLGVTVVVTAQNGESQRYSLLVQRGGPDRNANLASLSASAGSLTPAVSAKQDSYSLRLPADVPSARITAVAAGPRALVVFSSGKEEAEGAGTSVTVSVEPGQKSLVRFLVVAEDGTPRSYQVQVLRDSALSGK